MNTIEDNVLQRIETRHASGLTSAEILELFAGHQIRLSEATLRKYVQLGLLPRSVRVGRKGKHQGSQGVYPVSVVRQILRIKAMMAQSYTIEQIQREFLFMRSEIEQLDTTLSSIFEKIDRVLRERKGQAYAQAVARQVGDARTLSRDLMARLRGIESRLTARHQVERVAAS